MTGMLSTNCTRNYTPEAFGSVIPHTATSSEHDRRKLWFYCPAKSLSYKPLRDTFQMCNWDLDEEDLSELEDSELRSSALVPIVSR